MADFSEIGRFGTLRLMKRNEPDVVVASFPVDDEVVTFGRDPHCSVRLYYAWVSNIHCKIVFEERKAFLQVLGTNGVFVDGGEVLPATSPSSTPPTIPLINGSLIEIHKKRFQFTYPPKELRSHLLTTPHAKRRGSLRMSMIQSAQVFSPRPSHNPRENLRMLQSPLKPFPVASGREEVVRLVDGNHPRVVEEEQDLVILEDVQPPTPARKVLAVDAKSAVTPIPNSPEMQQRGPMTPVHNSPLQPKSPRRRSAPSLHRAVLIRSAQRAAVMLETQQLNPKHLDGEDDQREEEEVEEAVSAEMESSDSDEEQEQEGDFIDFYSECVNEHLNDRKSEQDGPTMEEHGEEQDITDAHDKGIDEGKKLSETEDHDDGESMDEDVSQNGTQKPIIAITTPPERNRPLGAFMTPQPRPYATYGIGKTGPQRPPPSGRLSLGVASTGAQRVRMLEPWKVKDIVVTVDDDNKKDNVALREASSDKGRDGLLKKVEVSEEEKNAIRERRRSAMTLQDPTLAHVPGTRRTSALPSPLLQSPLKSHGRHAAAEEGKVDEAEDIKSMLAKVQDTIDGMRRKSLAGRQSLSLVLGLGRGASATPSPSKRGYLDSVKGGFSLLAPSPAGLKYSGRGAGGFRLRDDVLMEETGSQAKAADDDVVGPLEKMRLYNLRGHKVNAINFEHGETMDVDEADGSHVPLDNDDGMESDEGEGHTEETALNGEAQHNTPTNSRQSMAGGPGQKAKNPTFTLPPKTPRMDGLKEMFRLPRANQATPSFKGMKEMFQPPNEVHTPAFDGLREMLITAQTVEEDIVDASMQGSISTATRTTSRSKATRLARNTPTDVSTMADDEATPSELATAPKRRTGSRSGKDTQSILKGAIVRRGRSRKVVDSDVEVIPEVEDTIPVESRRCGRSNRTMEDKQGDVNGELEGDNETIIQQVDGNIGPPSARKGRGTKAISPEIGKTDVGNTRAEQTQAAGGPVEELIPKGQKRVRNKHVKQEISESEVELRTQTTDVPPSRRGRPKKGQDSSGAGVPVTAHQGRSADIEADSNDDPLDAIEMPSSPDSSTAPVTKSRRGYRVKATVETIAEEEVQPRRKGRAMKPEQEERIDVEAPTGPTRGRKATGRKVVTKQGSDKHTAGVQDFEEDIDKENTPGLTINMDEYASTSSKSMNTKSTRSRTASKSSKTVEDVAPAQRVTRARTRK